MDRKDILNQFTVNNLPLPDLVLPNETVNDDHDLPF